MTFDRRDSNRPAALVDAPLAKAPHVAGPGENRLLAAIPRKERDRLQPFLRHVTLGTREYVVRVDEPIRHVYFPISAVFSAVITMADGATIEVGTVGNEGMVGVPVFLGADRSPTAVFSQVPGDSLRMAAADFRRQVVDRPGPLADLPRRYMQAYLNQVSQSVACNHLHSVQERMCRWLYMTQDRVGADRFPLAQEFLSHMLGVRRPTVTVVAQVGRWNSEWPRRPGSAPQWPRPWPAAGRRGPGRRRRRQSARGRRAV